MELRPGIFIGGQSGSRPGRFWLVAYLVALIAIGFVVFGFVDDRNGGIELQDFNRAPVANPPVDPHRPDLLEEPRIHE